MACTTCKAIGTNQSIVNGARNRRVIRKVHTLKRSIEFCYYHDIELHVLGERRYLQKYPKLLILIKKEIPKDDLNSSFDMDDEDMKF
jgi:hypothetical protein